MRVGQPGDWVRGDSRPRQRRPGVQAQPAPADLKAQSWKRLTLAAAAIAGGLMLAPAQAADVPQEQQMADAQAALADLGERVEDAEDYNVAQDRSLLVHGRSLIAVERCLRRARPVSLRPLTVGGRRVWAIVDAPGRERLALIPASCLPTPGRGTKD